MILLFPGQGVQGPGMSDGGDPDVLAEASELLGVDVPELTSTGSSGPADLSSTRWTQPAIVASSLARASALRRAGWEPSAVAGHSLGEYSALIRAGSLTLAEGLRLVVVRAEAMEDAAQSFPGVMVAVLGLPTEQVEEIALQAGASLAGENAPGQATVSGPANAVEQAVRTATEAGAKVRTIDAAGAFHSPAMVPAVQTLADALEDADVRAPELGFWSSTTAGPLDDEATIRDALLLQLVSPVRWKETIEGLAATHGPSFCDAGPGRVVAGLARRIVPGAEVTTVDEMLAGTPA